MDASVKSAIQQDRDRDRIREEIHEARRLQMQLLERIAQNAPSDDLRRQARFYLERLHEGDSGEH